MIANANLCRAMGGWRYEWVDTLPRAVYDVLIDDLARATAPKE